jgi:Uma2 family endonuclease
VHLDEMICSVAAYLAYEEASAEWHDYYEGRITHIPRGSANHNRIVGNLLGLLTPRLEVHEWRAHSSLAIVCADGLYTHPDLCVTGTDVVREAASIEVILNPRIVFEVLSPESERYDRSFKFHQYRRAASVVEIVLLQQDSPVVEHYTRHDDSRWLLSPCDGLAGVLSLTSVDCSLPLGKVYADVAFGTYPF